MWRPTRNRTNSRSEKRKRNVECWSFVGLAKKDLAENACAEIAGNFSALHPELPSRIFVAEMGDGLR